MQDWKNYEGSLSALLSMVARSGRFGTAGKDCHNGWRHPYWRAARRGETTELDGPRQASVTLYLKQIWRLKLAS
jgi:hypothetical protein